MEASWGRRPGRNSPRGAASAAASLGLSASPGAPSASLGAPRLPHLVIQEVQVISLRLSQLYVVQYHCPRHARRQGPLPPVPRGGSSDDPASARKLPNVSRHQRLRREGAGFSGRIYRFWLADSSYARIASIQSRTVLLRLSRAAPRGGGKCDIRSPLFLPSLTEKLTNGDGRRLAESDHCTAGRGETRCILGVVVFPLLPDVL